tara:strand:- start:497 stop:994 length:498 start_codon:yes stop_codon:yes gene_type:complete
MELILGFLITFGAPLLAIVFIITSIQKSKKADEAMEGLISKYHQSDREKKDLLRPHIVKLLKEKAVKMPASDIDAFLKYQNVDLIKELCEAMYHNGEISRTGNYRYFILNEEKKKLKPNKTSPPKPEVVDVKAELKKYKSLFEKGLIDQKDYDAKKKEILGLQII